MEKLRLLYIGNKLAGHGSTPTGIEILGARLESDGHIVAYSSSKKNKLLRFCDMVISVIKNRRADFVLIDTYSTQNFWYAVTVAALCRFLKIRYIPILHGGNLPVRLKSDPVVSSFLFEHSHINVAPSPYLKQVFENEGYSVAYIPNPVDIEKFEFRNREDVSPKLLWVRALSGMSNPAMAIEAFEKIAGKYPDAELCMVGPDKEGILPGLRNLARSKSLKVEFAGLLSKEQWAAKSSGFDIFINTSKVDNAPFSLIEAASLGMFIISTNVGGIPYLFEHRRNAILVGDNDSDSMADAVDELISNKQLRAGMQDNMQQFVKQFEWESVRARWSEILK